MDRSACQREWAMWCGASRRNIRPGCCVFRKHFSKCSPPSSSGENGDGSVNGGDELLEVAVAAVCNFARRRTLAGLWPHNRQRQNSLDIVPIVGFAVELAFPSLVGIPRVATRVYGF